jgi:hypothetical protein
VVSMVLVLGKLVSEYQSKWSKATWRLDRVH